MTAFLIANIAPLMFVTLIVVLLIGYPVAFSLAAVGIAYALLGIHLGLLTPSLVQALPERVWGVMSNDTLLAVPFFTFMGLILERSGMAEDLLDTIGQVFGPVRGGLAYAVIFVGALLAATTGVVAASVISMGLISLPIMLRYGYDRRFASGVIAACLYALYTMGVCAVKPAWAPALPLEARTLREPSGAGGTRSLLVLTSVAAVCAVAFAHWKYGPDDPTDEMLVVATSVGTGVAFFAAVLNRVFKLGLLSRLAERVVFVMIPPLALIFLVLGTIFLGVATPTEGGAMGASGALIMAVARKRLTWKLMRQAMDTTAKLSTFVVFILVGARVFSLTFYGVNGHVWVEQLLLHLPGGQLGFLIVVNVLIFFLAFFLDFFELSFIVIPLVGPVADKLGIDLIWFGVLLGVNMQTSFMHPPFGFALFYLRSVAPAKDFLDKVTGRLTKKVTTGQIYWGAVPFVLIQILMIALVITFPQMVMVYKASEKAFDIKKIQIIVPEDQSGPGNQPAGGGSEGNANIEQENAEKALEKELGGQTKDQGAPSDSAPGNQQDDVEKALQKELGGAKPPEEKK
jgi:TRAP-type mannitol/chloroaromatic compound transport system permease large subunit